MTTQTITPNATQSNTFGTPVGTTIPFDCINDAGAYICNWSGHLLRVPEDGVIPGRSPSVALVGPQPLTVTKISDNPFITVTKAKLLASNYDLNVNF